MKDFKKYFIGSGKVSEYTAIVSPIKNGREVAKATALSHQEKIEKNYFCKFRKKIKRQFEFQNQVLDLTSRSSTTQNEFSFPQNAI